MYIAFRSNQIKGTSSNYLQLLEYILVTTKLDRLNKFSDKLKNYCTDYLSCDIIVMCDLKIHAPVLTSIYTLINLFV